MLSFPTLTYKPPAEGGVKTAEWRGTLLLDISLVFLIFVSFEGSAKIVKNKLTAESALR